MKYLPTLLFWLCILNFSEPALLGIDLGDQNIKVGGVAHGKGLHIVLDGQSKRRIPSLVFFDDYQRFYGNDAINAALKKPQKSIQGVMPFLGYNGDYNSALDLWPDLKNLFSAGESNSSKEESIFFERNFRGHPRKISPTEVLAMHLRKIKHFNEASNELYIKDVVLTVPAFFTQSQRAAVRRAALLAGLNPLVLIGENAAAAANYASELKPNANKTVLLFNMGHSKTELTIVKFVRTAEANRTKKTATELDYAFDDALGGKNFGEALAADVAEAFAAKFGFRKEEVTSDKRAMYSLRFACEKAKKVLSANKETTVFVEEFFRGEDLSKTVTRKDFARSSRSQAARAGALLDRLRVPFEEVVLVGGATRIPALREELAAKSNKKISKTLNADEASALGAALRAANFSNAFRIRQVGLFERNPRGVEAFLADRPLDAKTAATHIEVSDFSKSALLFRKGEFFGKRRVLSFTAEKDIFGRISYSPDEKLPKGQGTLVFEFRTQGIADFHAQNKAKGAPKVSLVFELDGSGIVRLKKARGHYKLKPNSTGLSAKNVSRDSAENETLSAEPAEKRLSASFEVVYLRGSDPDGPLGGGAANPSRKLLDDFDERDEETVDSAEKMNALEELIYRYGDVVETDFFRESSTERERSAIAALLESTREWLFAASSDNKPNGKAFAQKRKALEDGAKPTMARMAERAELPKAVEFSEEVVGVAAAVINDTRANKTWIPRKELAAFSNDTMDFVRWLNATLEENKKLPKNKDLSVATAEIRRRANLVKEKAKEFYLREKIEKEPQNETSGARSNTTRKRKRRRRKSNKTKKGGKNILKDIFKKTKDLFGSKNESKSAETPTNDSASNSKSPAKDRTNNKTKDEL